jgi:hypothetical protein
MSPFRQKSVVSLLGPWFDFIRNLKRITSVRYGSRRYSWTISHPLEPNCPGTYGFVPFVSFCSRNEELAIPNVQSYLEKAEILRSLASLDRHRWWLTIARMCPT